jgi:hypothetical protein
MSTDFIYWTFTAAAQCVSTFVALLLTGYALVLSQIEAARDIDDSLREIHDTLRKSYHGRLTLLAWLTAIAVVLSLVVVWVNRANVPAPNPMMAAAAAADIAAIVLGLGFVITIIDPAKYQKVAERELEQQGSGAGGPQVEVVDFFRAYRKLERSLSEWAAKQELLPLPSTVKRGTAGLRSVADALLQNESISDEYHTELLQLATYRNLLFHGRAAEADAQMVERTRAALTRLRQEIKRQEGRRPSSSPLTPPAEAAVGA